MEIVVNGLSLPNVKGLLALPSIRLQNPILGTIGMALSQFTQVGGMIASIENAPVPPVGYPMLLGGESRRYQNPPPDKVIAIRVVFKTRTTFVHIIDGTDLDPQKHRILVDVDPANPRFRLV
jgi:hypothetical protein